MDNLKNTLDEQKTVIINSLDSLSQIAREVVQQKNKKIYLLASENNDLRGKITALGRGAAHIAAALGELRSLRGTNRLLRVLLKKESTILNLRKNIREIRKESEEKGTISGKDMTAFRIIALELEDREKMLRDSRILVESLENDRRTLALEKKNADLLNSSLTADLEASRKKNSDLESSSLTQLNTIETLSRELQGKNERVIELKDQFLRLLDSYNDILQKISEVG
jgi:hypothetical protein